MVVISDSDSVVISKFKFVSFYMAPTFCQRIKLNCKFPKELTLHIKWTCIIVIYYCFTAYCQYHSCFVVVGFHNSWCGLYITGRPGKHDTESHFAK